MTVQTYCCGGAIGLRSCSCCSNGRGIHARTVRLCPEANPWGHGRLSPCVSTKTCSHARYQRSWNIRDVRQSWSSCISAAWNPNQPSSTSQSVQNRGWNAPAPYEGHVIPLVGPPRADRSEGRSQPKGAWRTGSTLLREPPQESVLGGGGGLSWQEPRSTQNQDMGQSKNPDLDKLIMKLVLQRAKQTTGMFGGKKKKSDLTVPEHRFHWLRISLTVCWQRKKDLQKLQVLR